MKMTPVAVLLFFLVPKLASIPTKSSPLFLFIFISIILFVAVFKLGHSKSSIIQDFNSLSHILPPFVCEACRAEYYQLQVKSYEEDHNKIRDNKDDFLPRAVFVEYEKEKAPLLLEYFHDGRDGFHGYEEEEEDGGGRGGNELANKEEEGEEDFKRRIEEFIAKNIQKWREEKLLCITAG